jgi:hypothetical protein
MVLIQENKVEKYMERECANKKGRARAKIKAKSMVPHSQPHILTVDEDLERESGIDRQVYTPNLARYRASHRGHIGDK